MTNRQLDPKKKLSQVVFAHCTRDESYQYTHGLVHDSFSNFFDIITRNQVCWY